ncbi:hypothetical protein FPQ18DRAFT_307893 [Pyronema domesticum]|nr:hypothetical protein FPQ18DRAFT_307893 [Pyronema domesticum]
MDQHQQDRQHPIAEAIMNMLNVAAEANPQRNLIQKAEDFQNHWNTAVMTGSHENVRGCCRSRRMLCTAANYARINFMGCIKRADRPHLTCQRHPVSLATNLNAHSRLLHLLPNSSHQHSSRRYHIYTTIHYGRVRTASGWVNYVQVNFMITRCLGTRVVLAVGPIHLILVLAAAFSVGFCVGVKWQCFGKESLDELYVEKTAVPKPRAKKAKTTASPTDTAESEPVDSEHPTITGQR